jgi:hypothetical protein
MKFIFVDDIKSVFKAALLHTASARSRAATSREKRSKAKHLSA